MAWLCDTPCLPASCNREQKLWRWPATLYKPVAKLQSQKLYLWVQTLQNTVLIEYLLGAKQRSRDDVQVAKIEGALCPAVIELVCEALRNPGRRRSKA